MCVTLVSGGRWAAAGARAAVCSVEGALRALSTGLTSASSCRYVPSQADIAVFEAVGAPPPAELFHALRWYNHIKSYEKQKARYA